MVRVNMSFKNLNMSPYGHPIKGRCVFCGDLIDLWEKLNEVFDKITKKTVHCCDECYDEEKSDLRLMAFW